MINKIRSLLKNVQKSKNTSTLIKGCKNMKTKGITIKNNKFNPDEVLINYTKLSEIEIKEIVDILEINYYIVKVVPGVIFVSK